MEAPASAQLKRAIQEKAFALGFELFGVAQAAPADPEGRFAAWLSAGYHADLHYMVNRAKERADPKELFPGLRSVIVLGLFYRHPEELPRPPLSGDVSCYAQGADYHKVIGKKLKQLRAELQLLSPGASFYTEVDTGPVLEKVWAARAGLGWLAKSSNLVTRRGSWLFLATLLTDLELPQDEPIKDFCGSCSRCMEACPTQAIIAPGVVDARRCISYVTIENRGSIQRELRPLVGRWLFGCDDCQTVCPWQKFDPGSREPKFQARPKVFAPDLIELLQMNEADFLQAFQGTPVMRAKLRGLTRNALVVLGNLGDPSAIEAIRAVLLHHQDPMLRGHAAWALGRLQAKETLRQASQQETDESVLEEIGAALLGELPGDAKTAAETISKSPRITPPGDT